MTKSISIIGGGLAGLTAAVYLAQPNIELTVYEKSKALGGMARTTNKDGILFNMGAHALYRGGEGYKILKELGVAVNGKAPTFQKPLSIFNDELDLLPISAGGFLKTKLMTPLDKLEFGRCFFKITTANIQAANFISWQSWLENLTSNNRVRQLFLALSRLFTYTNAPEAVSAGAILYMFQIGIKKNVLYLDGGWQTIVDGLRTVAESRGVKFVTASKVTNIESDGNRVSLGFQNGGQVQSDGVIVAVDPQTASDLLPDSTRLAQLVENNRPVVAAALNVALSKLPIPEHTFSLGLDFPSYLSVHSGSAKLAPDGVAIVHLLKYLPDRSDRTEDSEANLKALEDVLDKVQPGWRQYVIAKSNMPHMIADNHLPTAEAGGFSGRHPVQVAEHDRVCLAGDWIGEKGWLADASFASGKAAAEAMIKTLRLTDRGSVAVPA